MYSNDDQGRVYQSCKLHLSHYSKYVFFLSINILHIDCYCVKGLWCCFPIPSLIFIYSMMGLLIYKYEPFWQEVSVKYLILRWPLRPVGLLFMMHQKAVLFQDINQARDKLNSSDPLVMKSWLIDWIVFYAVSAIFLPFNAGDY